MSKSQLKNNVETRSSGTSNAPSTVKGRVYSVILDENHFFFKDILGDFDPNYIGWIYWGNLNLKQGGLRKEDILKYCTLAKPYFNFLTYHPLNTEIVELIKGPSNRYYKALGGNSTNVEYFYFPPINVWNNSSGNPLPSESDIQRSEGELPLGEYTNEGKISTTTTMLPFEGDMILEGRFGNSIRFGSSTPRGKNNWSENDSEGEPITIISNGQSSDEYTPLEDINGDASSIYLTSNQNIQNLNIASKNFTSLNANFTEAPSGLEPIQAFTQNVLPTAELLNGPTLNATNDLPGDIVENQASEAHDDGANETSDENTPVYEGGYEDLVKIPGTYEDNSRVKRSLYLIPKRFSNGSVLITDILAEPLMRMLLAAESEGVKLTVNSGFRPPVDDIFINGKLIQKSQKAVRLGNLKPEYKGKIKEPWLEKSTVIEPFEGHQVGDSYNVTPQSKHFSPLTAASYKSPHGRSRACDFSTASATSEGYKWLARNGWKYGFIRTVGTEPWHFGYRPDKAKDGPTAILQYRYEPGKTYKETTNRWNNVFGDTEPNWSQELVAFQEQQAQQLNDQIT
jgi:hypothetical protein